MKLRFNVFGWEVARIELDIEREETPTVETVAVKAVKAVSKVWMGGLFR
jgi:hypothetical protein